MNNYCNCTITVTDQTPKGLARLAITVKGVALGPIRFASDEVIIPTDNSSVSINYIYVSVYRILAVIQCPPVHIAKICVTKKIAILEAGNGQRAMAKVSSSVVVV